MCMRPMVDGSEIRLITWYGKYPRIYQVLYIQQVIVWDFWTINSKQLDSITHTSSIHEYMIFLATNILLILLVNVGKYIHGSYGSYSINPFLWTGCLWEAFKVSSRPSRGVGGLVGNQDNQGSNDKPGWLFNLEDYTTQFSGDYYNKTIMI